MGLLIWTCLDYGGETNFFLMREMKREILILSLPLSKKFLTTLCLRKTFCVYFLSEKMCYLVVRIKPIYSLTKNVFHFIVLGVFLTNFGTSC